MTKISSQRYVDQEIVDEKIENKDFVVTIATINDEYKLVVDGHHSLEAAKQAGVAPEFIEADFHDYAREAMISGFDSFLEEHFIDSAWYDIETGFEVF